MMDLLAGVEKPLKVIGCLAMIGVVTVILVIAVVPMILAGLFGRG